MGNPPLVVCDTDALCQILLASAHDVLKCLIHYGVQPIVAPVVGVEMRSTKKFGAIVPDGFSKACAKGLIVVLNEREFRVPTKPSIADAKAASGTTWQEIEDRAARYELRADRGEAATFAAAVELKVPALSNDGSALRSMRYAALDLPVSVLRVFDLLALGRQTDHLSLATCDGIRQRLLLRNEWVPREFRNANFADGLVHFDPRLLDDSRPRVGRGMPHILLRPPTPSPSPPVSSKTPSSEGDG